MRGYTKRTPELVAKATRLRAERLTYAEIAERMKVPRSTVAEWVDDPDGFKRAVRKTRYSRTCVDCGRPTDGSHPEREPGRCRSCAADHMKVSTRAWILSSIEDWADLFGTPPSAADWNRSLARAGGMTWKVERYEATGRQWPSVSTAVEHFGSWRGALAAAGYEPRPVGRPRKVVS